MGVTFCLLPDIVWWIPMIVRQRLLHHDVTFHDMQTWYRASHSLVTAAAAYAVAYFFAGEQFAIGAAAGWILHIAMDTWTHRGGIVKGIAILYPFSNWRSPAVLWWSEELQKRPWVYLINLAAAAIVYWLTQ